MEQAIFFIIVGLLAIGLSVAFGRTSNFLSQHRTLVQVYGKYRIVRVLPEYSCWPFFVIEEKKKRLWWSYWRPISKSVEYQIGKFTEEETSYQILSEAQQAIHQLENN